MTSIEIGAKIAELRGATARGEVTPAEYLQLQAWWEIALQLAAYNELVHEPAPKYATADEASEAGRLAHQEAVETPARHGGRGHPRPAK